MASRDQPASSASRPEQLELLEIERAPLRDAGYVAGLLGIPRKSVLQYAREESSLGAAIFEKTFVS